MSESKRSQLITFLLVEDNDDHAQLIKRSLESNRVSNRIDHVRDGQEALDYLFRRGQYKFKSLPDVILLDLKLPGIDGHEVLRKIKGEPQLMLIPVVILTTSSTEIDRVKAYSEHANSYLVKPLDFESFRKMAQDLNLYWGMWNQSPH